MITSEKTEFETWKNPTAGTVWVNRVDSRGDVVKTEIIAPGRTFPISPHERRINQEMAYNEDQDIFSNGTLSPVRLIEGSEDAEAFASNPNLMTEDEMKALFASRSRATAFAERLSAIKNPAALRRLMDIATQEDAPISRINAIKARLDEVSGPTPENPMGARPVTPR